MATEDMNNLSIRQKAVLSVAEKTGMDRAEADRIMTEAKRKYGIRYADYDKYDFHTVPDEEKAAKAAEILRLREQKERREKLRKECIAIAMEACSWSHEEAAADLKEARQTYGLRFADYTNYEFYLVPAEEKAAAAERIHEDIKFKRERAEKYRQQCIALAMKEKGWTFEEAEADLNETRKRLGCGYIDYRRYHLFDIPREEQAERYAEIVATRENRKNRDDGAKERFDAYIMSQTGWNAEELEAKYEEAKERTGASWKDYYAFRFWEISDEEQAKYFTQYFSNALSDKYDVDDIHRDILLNKELSCREFSEFMGRAWCINRHITPDEFKDTFKNDKKVVYKPLDGNGGLGVLVFELEKDAHKSYEEIMKLPRGVVEAFVIQHPEMNKITPNSVNTLRVVCVSTPEFSKVAYAALRCGSGRSVVDNFTDGGMVVGIDITTGTVVTNGVTIDGDTREFHPETGARFKGFVIPCFKEAMEMVEAAGKKITGYIGWDVAISEKGPVLIEANIMPGNRILQMPYVEDRIGMRHIMEEFA